MLYVKHFLRVKTGNTLVKRTSQHSIVTKNCTSKYECSWFECRHCKVGTSLQLWWMSVSSRCYCSENVTLRAASTRFFSISGLTSRHRFIHLHGCWEALCERSVLCKNATQWSQLELRPRSLNLVSSTIGPFHWSLSYFEWFLLDKFLGYPFQFIVFFSSWH